MSAVTEPVDGLSLRGITRRFGARQAVAGVDLDVRRGQVLCLLGPSGCGKSTTLRIAAGLERPDTGLVFAAGRLVEGNGHHVPPEQRGVGLMFQDYALFPHLSVRANVAFGLNRLPRAEQIARADRELARVGLARLAEAYPHTLSGGEQQRIALARMLAPEPAVILMDEPFSGLDASLRETLRGTTLARLREANVAVLIVTHDPDEAMRVGDRVALMGAGKIIQEGTPLELYRAPKVPQAVALFGGANVFHTKVTPEGVRSPFGLVPANGVATGSWAEILFRPGNVRLADRGIQAVVVGVRPFGGATEVEARIVPDFLPEGVESPATVRASAPPGALLIPGLEIRLEADPNDGFVFPCFDKVCWA